MKPLKKTTVVSDDPFWTAMLIQILDDTLGLSNTNSHQHKTAPITNLRRNSYRSYPDFHMEEISGLDSWKTKGFHPAVNVKASPSFNDLSAAVNVINYGSFNYLLNGKAIRRKATSVTGNLLN